jgi:two-component system CheB/CheR fusion protein
LIEADVTAERLKSFFTPEGRGYRVSPELRNHVVFTVHDVLSDPPFAKVDIISCRNLLIYLLPEAQARVASAFHFALNPGGLLLLGNSEAIAADDDGFARVSTGAKPALSPDSSSCRRGSAIASARSRAP